MLPEPHRFVRRILTVVIEVDDVSAARVTPAAEHRVVLAEIARVLDERDRHPGPAHELAADLARAIRAAVV